MKNDKILLIDSSQLCYSALFTTNNLSYKLETTGVLFGFLRQVLKLVDNFDTNHLIFCWDTKESKRKIICPTYKANRNKNKTDHEKAVLKNGYRQFDLLKHEILPNLGFTDNYWQAGLEADDVLASIVNTNPEYKDRFVIVSTDNDLWQLLGKVHGQYDHSKKMLYTAQDFQEEWGILADDWWKVKMLSGCSSDHVKGIKGMKSGKRGDNEKAIRLLLDPSKLEEVLLENEEYLKLNKKLVKLPFSRTNEIQVKLSIAFDFGYFRMICMRYSFDSFLQGKTFSKWKNLLG